MYSLLRTRTFAARTELGAAAPAFESMLVPGGEVGPVGESAATALVDRVDFLDRRCLGILNLR